MLEGVRLSCIIIYLGWKTACRAAAAYASVRTEGRKQNAPAATQSTALQLDRTLPFHKAGSPLPAPLHGARFYGLAPRVCCYCRQAHNRQDMGEGALMTTCCSLTFRVTSFSGSRGLSINLIRLCGMALACTPSACRLYHLRCVWRACRSPRPHLYATTCPHCARATAAPLPHLRVHALPATTLSSLHTSQPSSSATGAPARARHSLCTTAAWLLMVRGRHGWWVRRTTAG